MKKGIFFSIVSVLLVILFAAIMSMMNETRGTENEIEVTRTRIKVLNSLMEDLDDRYFENLIYVSAKNALIGMSWYYSENKDRINDHIYIALEQTIDDGIIEIPSGATTIKRNLTSFSGKNYIKQEFLFDTLAEKLKAKYKELGMEINELDVTVIGVTQPDPWHLRVEADIIYDVKDMSGIAFWRGQSTKFVDVSLYGLYLYDLPAGIGTAHDNQGKVTSSWIIDLGPRRTEPTAYGKLSVRDPNGLYITPGHGICSPDFLYGGNDCSND